MLETLGAIGGLVSAGGGLMGQIGQYNAGIDSINIAKKNMGLQGAMGLANLGWQREANEKNEALMREAWAREDSATQRRAADLAAAGLSKTLAAGSAAGSMAPIQVRPQSIEGLEKADTGAIRQQTYANMMNMAATAASTLTQFQQARATGASADYLEAKADLAKEWTAQELAELQNRNSKILQDVSASKTRAGLDFKKTQMAERELEYQKVTKNWIGRPGSGVVDQLMKGLDILGDENNPIGNVTQKAKAIWEGLLREGFKDEDERMLRQIEQDIKDGRSREEIEKRFRQNKNSKYQGGY